MEGCIMELELRNLNLELARSLVQRKHYGMTYRSSNPNSMYTQHILPVAKIVWDESTRAKYPFEVSQDLWIAALLHDTVEDTDITVDMVKFFFGDTIADLVWRVTDEPG